MLGYNTTLLLKELKDITLHRLCQEESAVSSTTSYEICKLVTNLHTKYSALAEKVTEAVAEAPSVDLTSPTNAFVIGGAMGLALASLYLCCRRQRTRSKRIRSNGENIQEPFTMLSPMDNDRDATAVLSRPVLRNGSYDTSETMV